MSTKIFIYEKLVLLYITMFLIIKLYINIINIDFMFNYNNKFFNSCF